MQSNDNIVVIASAGSGKTTFLVDEAVSRPGNRIALLTYTNNNVAGIKRKLCDKCGAIPERVDVKSWFSFLLHECVRPYQRSVYSKKRVKTIRFTEGRSAPYAKYKDPDRYYFENKDAIYSDKTSRFAIDCEKNSQGMVTKRLGDIYDEIYIDEFQDLAGYDLELVEIFLKSKIRTVMVGDPRQCTYTTNNALINSAYRGMGIFKLISRWKKDGLCKTENLSRSYRCNPAICSFSDKLWPSMEATESFNSNTTNHDGIFLVSKNDADRYIELFAPAVLRYDRKTKDYEKIAMNFGNAKGLEFERVLIIPHGSIIKYLNDGNIQHVDGSKEKFYVAVTRARQSVAFLYDGPCSIPIDSWSQ